MKALDIWLFMCIFFVFSAIVDCIVDLRFLSMVEKESQIAGEEGAADDMPPIVDERLRTGRGGGGHRSTLGVGDVSASYVRFCGNNTPFQVRFGNNDQVFPLYTSQFLWCTLRPDH